MRIMEELVNEYGLTSELEERLIEETGNTNFWLGVDSDMDEPSDEDDPEEMADSMVHKLYTEVQDKKSFVDAVQGALDNRAMARDLDRARMQLEDLRGLR